MSKTLNLVRNILILNFSLFFLFCPKSCRANETVFFEENFNSSTSDFMFSSKWDVYSNLGTIYINEGNIKLDSFSYSFPFVKTKINPFPEEDFVLEMKLKYLRSANWGTGISIGTEAPYNGISQEELLDLGNDVQMFFIWQDDHRDFHVSSRNCYQCNPEVTDYLNWEESVNEDLFLNIMYIDGYYEVILNDVSYFRSSQAVVKKPSVIWFGNPISITTDGSPWTSFEIDYIRVKTSGYTHPVILLPGHGGSWCWDGLILGKECNEWKQTPFVHVYDNFRSSMLNAGYTEGVDYYEFYYDWRDHLDNLAADLDTYIDSTVLNGSQDNTKVKLVGHSMGGLVSRTYAQNYGTEKLEKVVTVGSPHKGALAAYRGWEGGETTEYPSWRNVAFEILVQIHKDFFENRMKAVRELAPSTKEMIPIFDFLKENDGTIKKSDSLIHTNNFLINLQESMDGTLKSIMATVNGRGENSVEYYVIKDRNVLDKLMGRWEDGRVETREMTDEGDGTVLTKGAEIEVVNTETLDMGHTELIETYEGLEKIFNALNINVTPNIVSVPSPIEDALVFIIRSPAKLRITASDGEQAGYGIDNPISGSEYYEEEGIVIIHQLQEGDYKVEVIPTGSGEYHLDIGKIKQEISDWKTFKGQIDDLEQKDEYNFVFSSGSEEVVLDTPKDGVNYVQLSIIKLNHLENYIRNNVEEPQKDQFIWHINIMLEYLQALKENEIEYKYTYNTMKQSFLLRRKLENIENEQNRVYCKNQVDEVIKYLKYVLINRLQQNISNPNIQKIDNFYYANNNTIDDLEDDLEIEAEKGPNNVLASLYKSILKSKETAENTESFEKWAEIFSNRFYLWSLLSLLSN